MDTNHISISVSGGGKSHVRWTRREKAEDRALALHDYVPLPGRAFPEAEDFISRPVRTKGASYVEENYDGCYFTVTNKLTIDLAEWITTPEKWSELFAAIMEQEGYHPGCMFLVRDGAEEGYEKKFNENNEKIS